MGSDLESSFADGKIWEENRIFFEKWAGVYSGYWGLDAEGEAVCLTVVFMNPEYF